VLVLRNRCSFEDIQDALMTYNSMDVAVGVLRLIEHDDQKFCASTNMSELEQAKAFLAKLKQEREAVKKVPPSQSMKGLERMMIKYADKGLVLRHDEEEADQGSGTPLSQKEVVDTLADPQRHHVFSFHDAGKMASIDKFSSRLPLLLQKKPSTDEKQAKETTDFLDEVVAAVEAKLSTLDVDVVAVKLDSHWWVVESFQRAAEALKKTFVNFLSVQDFAKDFRGKRLLLCGDLVDESFSSLTKQMKSVGAAHVDWLVLVRACCVKDIHRAPEGCQEPERTGKEVKGAFAKLVEPYNTPEQMKQALSVLPYCM